jgi:hypothetical protein
MTVPTRFNRIPGWTPAAEKLYQANIAKSLQVGAEMLADPFITKDLPELLEACKDSKLRIPDDFSTNFTIGSIYADGAIWFKTTMRNNKTIQKAIEATTRPGYRCTNLELLKYAMMAEQSFVKRGNIIHFGPEGK